MQNYHKLLVLIIAFISTSAFGLSKSNSLNYWKCSIKDNENRVWTASNSYQKIAFNVAIDNCKKGSKVPASCMASKSTCVNYSNGINMTPMWECTAIDESAEPWVSNPNPQREEAALSAKAYCQENSQLPDTCYINLITCININDEAS